MPREDDFPSFLIALRNIAKVHGGICARSESTELGRVAAETVEMGVENIQVTTLHSSVWPPVARHYEIQLKIGDCRSSR